MIMEVKEIIQLNEREIKNALSEYVQKRGYIVSNLEFGFKQDFKNMIKVTDVKMEVREATDQELIRPFLPSKIAKALDIMWVLRDMPKYEIISSLDHEKFGMGDHDLMNAHKELREWAFEEGKNNMNDLFKAITNGYERKDFWMK
jgi:hypothetical protein